MGRKSFKDVRSHMSMLRFLGNSGGGHNQIKDLPGSTVPNSVTESLELVLHLDLLCALIGEVCKVIQWNSDDFNTSVTRPKLTLSVCLR